MYVFIILTEWPPIGKIAAHSAYYMFSKYKYLIVSLVFPTSVFGVGVFFMIARLPDLCLLVPSNTKRRYRKLSEQLFPNRPFSYLDR